MNELDKLYLPYMWSKRPQVIEYHLNFIENESAKTRHQIPCQLNVAYGQSERQKIDIFGTDLPDESPIFIYIHGGYWQTERLTRASYHFIANNLHENNIKSIFLGYDLCPNVTLPEIVRQFENGVKKSLEYALETRSRGVYLMGHSAGAHLISTLFTDLTSLPVHYTSMIKGAFLVSGIYDLEPVQKTVVNNLVKMDETTAKELSSMKLELRTLKECVCNVLVGRHESPEFLRQSEEFVQKLEKNEMEATMEVVPDVDHFDIIEMLGSDDYEISKFLINVINNLL